jgi:mono/diheme cytochrome c family protein
MRRAALLGPVLLALLSLQGLAIARDSDAVTGGRKVWIFAGCSNCHGDKGQGGTQVDFPAGPSLRTTTLDHKAMVEVISCGRAWMPAWLKGAYTDRPCYGTVTAPVPAQITSTGALNSEQIEALVNYVMATIVVR